MNRNRHAIFTLSVLGAAALCAWLVFGSRGRAKSGGEDGLANHPHGELALVLAERMVERGETALVRANAYAAGEMLRSGKGDFVAVPMLLRSVLCPDEVYDHVLFLYIGAIRFAGRDSELIMVFADGARTVCMTYPIAPVEGSGFAPDIGWYSLLVPKEDLLKGVSESAKSIVVMAGPYIATGYDGRNGPEKAIAVPDCEVAVGLRCADGTYSNFVPVFRYDHEGSDTSKRRGD
jgi:hypothetical protein